VKPSTRTGGSRGRPRRSSSRRTELLPLEKPWNVRSMTCGDRFSHLSFMSMARKRMKKWPSCRVWFGQRIGEGFRRDRGEVHDWRRGGAPRRLAGAVSTPMNRTWRSAACNFGRVRRAAPAGVASGPSTLGLLKDSAPSGSRTLSQSTASDASLVFEPYPECLSVLVMAWSLAPRPMDAMCRRRIRRLQQIEIDRKPSAVSSIVKKRAAGRVLRGLPALCSLGGKPLW